MMTGMPLPWIWPLHEGPAIWPDAPGRFGTIRKHDIHTGIDLYCHPGMTVRGCEPGIVVAIEDFTGPRAGSPWWHDTQAVLVEGASGVIVYGELRALVRVGDRVDADTCLGGVVPVLRASKGGRPTTMLHVELLTHGTRSTPWWRLGDPRPECLCDPTPRLREAWTLVERDKHEYSSSGS